MLIASNLSSLLFLIFLLSVGSSIFDLNVFVWPVYCCIDRFKQNYIGIVWLLNSAKKFPPCKKNMRIVTPADANASVSSCLNQDEPQTMQIHPMWFDWNRAIAGWTFASENILCYSCYAWQLLINSQNMS